MRAQRATSHARNKRTQRERVRAHNYPFRIIKSRFARKFARARERERGIRGYTKDTKRPRSKIPPSFTACSFSVPVVEIASTWCRHSHWGRGGGEGCVIGTNVAHRIPARRSTRFRPADECRSPAAVRSVIAGRSAAGISMHLRCIGIAGRARTCSRPFLPHIGGPRICILQSP